MRWGRFPPQRQCRRCSRRWRRRNGRRRFSVSGGGGLGIGTIIVLGLIGWALGIDPRILIGGAEILRAAPISRSKRKRRRRRKARRPTRWGRVCCRRARLDRGCVDRDFRRQRPDLSRAAAAPVLGRDQCWPMRHGPVGNGSVLLSAGSPGLPRHVVFSRHGTEIPRLHRQAMPVCGGLRDRP